MTIPYGSLAVTVDVGTVVACPGCHEPAAEGTWPSTLEGRAWWCMKCLHARAHHLHEEAKEATKEWRKARMAVAKTGSNTVESSSPKKGEPGAALTAPVPAQTLWRSEQ